MGGMTVATPTTGIAFAPALAPDTSARILVTCSACKTAADAREPFCAHCGTRITLDAAVAATGKSRPADVAATRALQFGLIVVIANIVIGGLALGVVVLASDAARFADVALALDTLKFVVVGTLSVVAIRYGVRGVRATRDGQLRRRGWAIAGIAIGGLFAALVTLSVLSTLALTVVLPLLA